MKQPAPWQGASDRELLNAALDGDTSATEAANARLLPNSKFSPFVRGLAPDLQEEVRSEVWLALVSRRQDVLLTLLPLPTVLTGLVRDAAKRVRAQNRPPGARSRRRRGQEGIRTADSLDALPEAMHPATGGEEEMFAILELNAVMDAATQPVREALALVHMDGRGLEFAAAAVGMTRRTLLRRIMALRDAA